MSSQTPRRLSLRRKRQQNENSTTDDVSPKRISPSFGEELNFQSRVALRVAERSSKSGVRPNPPNTNVILQSPKLSKQNKNDKLVPKLIPPSTPTTERPHYGVSSETPNSSGQCRRDSLQRLRALQRSNESRNLQFSSPDSPFTCSQLPSTQDCEVVWDCNSPGYSKEELKKLNTSHGKLVSSKTPSPKGVADHHPNRILFNLNRPNPRFRRENRSNKSFGIVAELDDLLTKIQAEEVSHINDSLSEDETMPERLLVSNLLDKSTQPFDVSMVDESISNMNQRNVKTPVPFEDHILSSVKTCQTDHLRPTLPKEASAYCSELTEDDLDDIDFDNDSWINSKSSVNVECKVASPSNNNSIGKIPHFELKKSLNNDPTDSLNSTSNCGDDDDDDFFSDSLLICTQELENALYNKKADKLNSPIINANRKGNPELTTTGFIKSVDTCGSKEISKPVGISSNAFRLRSDNITTLNNKNINNSIAFISSIVKKNNPITDGAKMSRSSFQLGKAPTHFKYNSESNKSALKELNGDHELNAALQNNNVNFYASNLICNNTVVSNCVNSTVGTLTRSRSVNSATFEKSNVSKNIHENYFEKNNAVNVTIKKHLSTNSSFDILKFEERRKNIDGQSHLTNASNLSDVKVVKSYPNFKMDVRAPLPTENNKGMIKLNVNSMAATGAKIVPSQSLNGCSQISSQDNSSVFEKGFSEEDDDDEIFASLIPLVENEEKNYSKLGHCIIDFKKVNSEIEIRLGKFDTVNESISDNIKYKSMGIETDIKNGRIKATDFVKNCEGMPACGSGNKLKLNSLKSNGNNNNVDADSKVTVLPIKKTLLGRCSQSTNNSTSKSINSAQIKNASGHPMQNKNGRNSFKFPILKSTPLLTPTAANCFVQTKNFHSEETKGTCKSYNFKNNPNDTLAISSLAKLTDISSAKMAFTKNSAEPLPSQSQSSNFDDEDDFFDDDILDEISIMESQVQSLSSQDLQPETLIPPVSDNKNVAASISFLKKEEVKVNSRSDSKCTEMKVNFTNYNERCKTYSAASSEELNRFDEFFSLCSPVSKKNKQMTLKEKYDSDTKNPAKLPHFVKSNVTNLAVNRIQAAITRVSVSGLQTDGPPMSNGNLGLSFGNETSNYKSSLRSFNGSSSVNSNNGLKSIKCTQDEIAKKREEALKKRQAGRMTKLSFVS